MSGTPVTVLDHIDNIAVPGNVFEQPANEYWALVCLWQGMEFLYRQVQKCDDDVRQRVNPHGNLTYVGMGNLPEMQAVPAPLLTSAFHWYAISACQYARTVGAIACRQNAKRPLPPHYVKAVMPDVLAFRDKVAAHFAWASQHSKDNDAERLASILPSLSFEDDAFHVGGFSVALRRGGKESNSESIGRWSLCRVHEQLRSRYWPAPIREAPDAEPGAAPDPAT